MKEKILVEAGFKDNGENEYVHEEFGFAIPKSMIEEVTEENLKAWLKDLPNKKVSELA